MRSPETRPPNPENRGNLHPDFRVSFPYDPEVFLEQLSPIEIGILHQLSEQASIDFNPEVTFSVPKPFATMKRGLLGTPLSDVLKVDYHIEPSFFNPTVEAFMIRQLMEVESDLQKYHSNPSEVIRTHITFVTGQIGSGKTYEATKIEQLITASGKRWEEKYGTKTYTHRLNWDAAETKLMHLTEDADNFKQYAQILTTQKYLDRKLPPEALIKIQHMLYEAIKFQDDPFNIVEPYPESFMTATETLLSLQLMEVTSHIESLLNQNGSSPNEAHYIIVDAAAGGTEYVFPLDHDFTPPSLLPEGMSYSQLTSNDNPNISYGVLKNRTFAGTLGFQWALGLSLFPPPNERLFIPSAVIVYSATPYQYTALRMCLMIAQNPEEAVAILNFFGVHRMTMNENEFYSLQKGGLFPHLNFARKKTLDLISFVSQLERLGIPQWMHQTIIKKTINPHKIPDNIKRTAFDIASLRTTTFVRSDQFNAQAHNIVYRLAAAQMLQETYRLAQFPETHLMIANNTKTAMLDHMNRNRFLTEIIFKWLSTIKKPEDLVSIHDLLISHIIKNLPYIQY